MILFFFIFLDIFIIILSMKNTEKSSVQILENKVAILCTENSFYKNELLMSKSDNFVLKNEITTLKEQLEWFKRQLFGKRSEKVVSNLNQNQLILQGFENLQSIEEQKQTIEKHERNKPNRDGKDKIVIPSDLPVKTTILDIPEDQKFCKETGKPLVKIGEEVTHKLAHTPGSYYIHEIIRPKYAIPEEGILTAELPDSIIPKCRADESLLAEILTQKFADHLPLYRISEILKREDIFIHRSVLSQWVVRCGLALKPLRDEMLKQIFASKNIFVDETPVKFIEDESKTGYLWVICGGLEQDPPFRVYFFSEGRQYKNALELLNNYEGSMHSDKYGAYVELSKKKSITWHPCYAHIRRKFFEAQSGDSVFREWVLEEIKKLFELEEKAWLLTPEERLKIRKEQEEPIIDGLILKIKDKLLNGKILPKSKLREALGYFCSLIPNLKNYLEHPFAHIDNNVAERAIRPIAIGRKNWLFFGSLEGGEAGSIILSLVQTCRGLNINPREYLEDVLRRLMSHSAKKLSELLPDQWRLNKESKNLNQHGQV